LENDSIRSIGSDTLVDIWIEGKMRALCVSQEAIGAFLGFERAGGMSDMDRREFVRTHLPLVISAAKTRLGEAGADADALTIDVGQLPRSDGRSGERRLRDRRKTERRQAKVARPGQQERRKGDRRQGDRRTRPPKPKDS
jgi:hypothetical protein